VLFFKEDQKRALTSLHPNGETEHWNTKAQYAENVLVILTEWNCSLKTPWPQSARELYGPSDRRLSTKSVPTFVDRDYRVVRATDSYGRILEYLERKVFLKRVNIDEYIY
jgi:hypothetical protein